MGQGTSRKVKLASLAVLWVGERLGASNMMPEWVPQPSDELWLMIYGGLLVWSATVLCPEAVRAIVFTYRASLNVICKFRDAIRPQSGGPTVRADLAPSSRDPDYEKYWAKYRNRHRETDT